MHLQWNDSVFFNRVDVIAFLVKGNEPDTLDSAYYYFTHVNSEIAEPFLKYGFTPQTGIWYEFYDYVGDDFTHYRIYEGQSAPSVISNMNSQDTNCPVFFSSVVQNFHN